MRKILIKHEENQCRKHVHVELHYIDTQIKKLMDNMFKNDVKYTANPCKQ